MCAVADSCVENVCSRHEEIVDKSLLLFHELASGYSSSKTLSKLDVVIYTLVDILKPQPSGVIT